VGVSSSTPSAWSKGPHGWHHKRRHASFVAEAEASSGLLWAVPCRARPPERHGAGTAGIL